MVNKLIKIIVLSCFLFILCAYQSHEAGDQLEITFKFKYIYDNILHDKPWSEIFKNQS